MKTLKIYKENGEFVIESSNSLNEIRKRYFLEEEDLEITLIAYSFIIDEYKIEASDEVRSLVDKLLRK